MTWPCTQKISPRLRSKFDLCRDAHEQSIQPQPFDFPFEEWLSIFKGGDSFYRVQMGTGLESDSLHLCILSQALSSIYFIWTCQVDTWFCCISLPWTLEAVHDDYRWHMTIQYMTYMTHASHLSLKLGRVLCHRCGERPTMSSLRIVDLAGSDWRGWKLLSSIGSFVDFCWLSMTFQVDHQRRPHINLA